MEEQVKNMYDNGKIYKIVSDQTDMIYIGSTTQLLHNRMAGHRRNLKHHNKGNRKICSSFELLDKYSDCQIILIEDYPCKSKEELRSRERYHIENNKEICVNINIPTRTQQEWLSDYKDYVCERGKKYYEDNKEIINKKHKQYYEDNKEKILLERKQYQNDNKEKIAEYQKEYKKEYQIKNRDILSQQAKKYYEENKEEIKKKNRSQYENNKKIIKCECGLELIEKSYKRHTGSQKHKNAMEKLQQQ